MADVSTNEDTALRYVLGELNDAERREFESDMAASAELRTLVSELESGVVAMANAAPRRRAPAAVWRRIEKTMVKETRSKLAFPSFWFGWLRNGWAATAACLMGWLLYAFFVNRHETVRPTPLKNSPGEIVRVTPAKPVIKPDATAITNTDFEILQAHMQEIMALRGKIGQLETARTQLSQLVARQNALLSETNRIKFYHLTMASSTGGNGNPAPLSPGLQHAVQMALARELGWLPADPSPTPQTSGNATPKPVTIGGVDFVDFPPGHQTVASQPPTTPAMDNTAANTASTTVQPPAQPQTGSPATSPTAPATAPTIPAYVSGNNLVVALDSTTVPAGSLVTLTATDGSQNQTGGSFILGDNPTVATLGFNSTTGGYAMEFNSAGGVSWAFVTMSFQSPDGLTGIFQFLAPPTPLPTSNP
jgi:hypothetical protein